MNITDNTLIKATQLVNLILTIALVTLIFIYSYKLLTWEPNNDNTQIENTDADTINLRLKLNNET